MLFIEISQDKTSAVFSSEHYKRIFKNLVHKKYKKHSTIFFRMCKSNNHSDF